MGYRNVRGTPFRNREDAQEWIERQLKYGYYVKRLDDGTIVDNVGAPVEIITYADRAVIKAEMKLTKV
jgi:hypothetical protein